MERKKLLEIKIKKNVNNNQKWLQTERGKNVTVTPEKYLFNQTRDSVGTGGMLHPFLKKRGKKKGGGVEEEGVGGERRKQERKKAEAQPPPGVPHCPGL